MIKFYFACFLRCNFKKNKNWMFDYRTGRSIFFCSYENKMVYWYKLVVAVFFTFYLFLFFVVNSAERYFIYKKSLYENRNGFVCVKMQSEATYLIVIWMIFLSFNHLVKCTVLQQIQSNTLTISFHCYWLGSLFTVTEHIFVVTQRMWTQLFEYAI